MVKINFSLSKSNTEKSNAKQPPAVYYCKHITAGVCGYEDETILITNDTLKLMDNTFAGKPVYVDHQKVNLENLQKEADGYVAESFFLPADGCHWAKFIAVSDKAHKAIADGYKVSNAYLPDDYATGGEWHNIQYNREITAAHYTHLALVANPRYEEAVIMTPEEFKSYKEEKERQLKQLENSKEGKTVKGDTMAFKIFSTKKEEIKNSAELANAEVQLENGKSVSIKDMIAALEAKNAKDEKDEILDATVKVNGEDVSVRDLVKKYEQACKNSDEDEEEDKEDKEAKKASKKGKRNADEDGKDEAENADEDDEEDKGEKKSKKNSKKGFFEELENAADEADELSNSKDGFVVDTTDRKVARGAARYGSVKEK